MVMLPVMMIRTITITLRTVSNSSGSDDEQLLGFNQ